MWRDLFIKSHKSRSVEIRVRRNEEEKTRTREPAQRLGQEPFFITDLRH
jgi:hypothetical protein